MTKAFLLFIGMSIGMAVMGYYFITPLQDLSEQIAERKLMQEQNMDVQAYTKEKP